jgi:hypothetical protein
MAIIPMMAMRITTMHLMAIPTVRQRSDQDLHARCCHIPRDGPSFILY